MKVMLILVDGMRPDGLPDIPEARDFIAKSEGSLAARTVFPPVTLPCHVSLFHSVPPDRHGTTTNDFTPMVRPVKGICEVLHRQRNAFFYNWEALRDLSRPGSLSYSYMAALEWQGCRETNRMVTDEAIRYIAEKSPDFAFVYLGWLDIAGHGAGWLTDDYFEALRESWKQIAEITATLDDEWQVIVTADHGGHGRDHSKDIPEDMTIPILCSGTRFTAGKEREGLSILDIAPTIATLFDADIPAEWEGKSIV